MTSVIVTEFRVIQYGSLGDDPLLLCDCRDRPDRYDIEVEIDLPPSAVDLDDFTQEVPGVSRELWPQAEVSWQLRTGRWRRQRPFKYDDVPARLGLTFPGT